ncbi:MAG: hypothetical protein R3E31_20555 [Chloroflexota bacterium]
MLLEKQLPDGRNGRILRALLLIVILVGSMFVLVINAAGQEDRATAPENPSGNTYGTYLPAEMSYQGQLVNASGQPQIGTYNMQLAIYGPPPTSTLRYSEIQTVATDQEGLFNVMIGAVQPGLDAALAGGDAWLQVLVNGDLLTPLQPIGTVPYAQYAQKLVGGTGLFSAIGGGEPIETPGDYATISGGYDNLAAGYGAAIGGGRYNRAAGADSAIAGGSFNSAVRIAAVGGGFNNTAIFTGTTISGGYNNSAEATYSTIGGGTDNLTGGDTSVIGGGTYNTTAALGATIGGGTDHIVDGQYATVGGGEENSASGYAASVAGGRLNSATGSWRPFPAASATTPAAREAWLRSRFASAVHDGAFVWNDGTTVPRFHQRRTISDSCHGRCRIEHQCTPEPASRR